MTTKAVDERGRWRLLDKYGLRTLKAGHTKYHAVEKASDAERITSVLHTTAEHYRRRGYIHDKIFTVTITTHDEVGILYGLKKGHSNEL